jgi:4-amino-4-deoxy-L-arabinose transferase-like glycosyltransferase
MNRFAERYGTVVLIAIAAGILIYAGAFAPVGLKLIDEVIYNAAAVSFADRGALIVENGWDRFGADALRINFLVPGPHGLASQYPPGAAVLGAPLQRLFGLQGLILLNALAAMATLFVTRAVARSAFGREDVALSAVLLLVLASFWVEYAFGIWPHSLGTLMVLIAFWAGLRGLAADPAAALRWAVLAGSVAGAGLLIRADTVLIVPALAAAAILFAPRPWSMIGAGLAGLAPFVALASWVNHYKFDRWNPLTYGLDKPGGVELSGHVPVILLVAGVFLCLAVARGLRWQPGRGPWILLACAAAALALLVPPVRALFIAYGQGFFGLVVDAKPLPNFEPTEWNGVVYFWELPKKALGQNMPWIGCLLGAVFLPLTARERRVLILCALAAFVWTLPFILRSWHGNYGANMRYFLPLLPLLAVVGAWLWHRLADMTGAGGLVLGLGAIYAGGLAALWSVLHASGFDGAQQIMSTHLAEDDHAEHVVLGDLVDLDGADRALPFFITDARSHRLFTWWMSWSIRKMPMPCRFFSSSISSATIAGLSGFHAQRGGRFVHDQDLGVEIDRAAIATDCRCPPDSPETGVEKRRKFGLSRPMILRVSASIAASSTKPRA